MKEERAPNRQLNALLDAELSEVDAERLQRVLNDNPVLQRRLDELRRVKNLIRRALQVSTVETSGARRRFPAQRASAASGLLLLGFVVGWLTSGADFRQQHPASGIGVNGEARVVLHLATNDRDKMVQTLDKAEKFLAHHRHESRPLRLEVVVNGDGLDLLRADISPERERVRALQQRYHNLAFLACRKTMEHLKHDKGIEPPLLPEVITVPSALDQIIERVQTGWQYVQT